MSERFDVLLLNHDETMLKYFLHEQKANNHLATLFLKKTPTGPQLRGTSAILLPKVF